MKDNLNRFGVQVVRLKLTDEPMTVHAFVKGMLLGPFSESLLRFYPKTFTEIRRQALAHITANDRVTEKRGLVLSLLSTSSSRTTSAHEGTRGNHREEGRGKTLRTVLGGDAHARGPTPET